MITPPAPKKNPAPPAVMSLNLTDVNRALADLAARVVAAETRVAILEAQLKSQAPNF